jgi:hypothetical protein
MVEFGTALKLKTDPFGAEVGRGARSAVVYPPARRAEGNATPGVGV